MYYLSLSIWILCLTKDEEKCINVRIELAALVNGLDLGVEKVWLTANPGSVIYEKWYLYIFKEENINYRFIIVHVNPGFF